MRKTLTQQSQVVNKRKEKRLFGIKELIEFNNTFWTADEGYFIHPRNKAQIPFLMSVYCWTGARIGSFFPDKDGKADAGLRYRVYLYIVVMGPLLIATRILNLSFYATLKVAGRSQI